MLHTGQSGQSTETHRAPVDPRAICNLMLDEAGTRISITNLALQKLLYFAHGLHLIETGRPLVTGYFEAWQFGPVHPAAYMAFKVARDRPIDFRAQKRDPLTGVTSAIEGPSNEDAIMCVRKVVMSYARMTPGRLVEISHAPDAPWAWVVKSTQESMAFGLRIPDNVIVERFRYHKVSVGASPAKGEPREDSPFAA